MSGLKRNLAGLILTAIWTYFCMAQGSAEIKGSVEDQSGAVVPYARISLINNSNGKTYQSTTDEMGQFRLGNVDYGKYLLKASGEALQNAEMTVLVSGHSALIQVKMKIRTGEQITVSSTALDRVSPEANSNAVTINDNFLRSLPSDNQSLLPLLNNFVSPAAGGTSGLSVVVDGLEADQLDDVPASAIKRVAVDKNPYAAEYRRPGKARVEITTKTGSTKLFHGGIALFSRNSAFDAQNKFADSKPALNRTFWEGTFSGPFALKRSSFFVAGQHFGEGATAIVNANTPTGPLVENIPTAQHGTDLLGRVDFRLARAQTLSVLYGFNKRTAENQNVGGLYLPTQGMGTTRRTNRIQIMHQSVLSPNLLNTIRFMARNQISQTGTFPAGPAIVVNGAFVGGFSQNSQLSRENVLELEDVAVRGAGRHTLRFGGTDWTRIVNGSDRSNFGGTFQFSDLNHFAAGLPYAFRINQGEPNISFPIHIVSGFGQDEIRVRPNLNLTLGLRYDWQSNLDRRTNLAPRIALAYAPGDQKTVFRAGAGIFYEYLPVPALWRSSLFDAARQKELVITNPSFPNPFAPGTKSFSSSIFRLDPNLKAPYVIQSSVGIERQLWKNAQITVEAYVICGLHQFRTLDINAPLPQTGVRPISSFLNVYQLGSGALMQGKGLSVSFRGGIGKRVYLVAQYNLSRTINDVNSMFSLPASNYDLQAERGRADFDRRHRFSLTGMVNLPGSMRVGTLLALATGAPFDITTGFDGNHDTVANDRPPGVTRNQGQGTGMVQMDLRFTKLFSMPRVLSREGSAKNFEINVDAFNALNHPNLTSFIGVRNSASFGKASVALPGRTIQFSLRYRF